VPVSVGMLLMLRSVIFSNPQTPFMSPLFN
jgi:hypothetical protein